MKKTSNKEVQTLMNRINNLEEVVVPIWNKTAEELKTKPWYESKTIQAGIIIALISIVNYFGFNIPNEIYGIAIAYGLYGLRKAEGKIV